MLDVTNEERILGKKLPNQKVFDASEDWAAMVAAENFVRGMGYSIGTTQSGAPAGIKKGVWHIEKWRNLSDSDKKLMDGLIIGNFRNGPLTVIWA